MHCESTFATNDYRDWKHATETNRDFSKHAAFKEHLAGYVPGKKKSNGLKWIRRLPY